MMTRTSKLYARTCALPAIAAALALSSTQALAQDAAQQTQPATTEPAPATTTAPTTSTDPLAPTADTSATDSSAQKTTRTTSTVKRSTRVAAAKPAPATTHLATRTATAHAATPTPTAAATPKPAAATPQPTQSAVPPVVNYQPNPASAPKQAAVTNSLNLRGDTVPIAAGGALALLALGGAAAAVTGRRRRRREQEWADAETMSYQPFETTAAAEPEPVATEERPAVAVPPASAFAWGNRPEAAAANAQMSEGDDRLPGETWVQRAYRGPTPNNPSVSLRNRLKRAAFFDKREREAAAGTAQPVSANAGLPGAMTGERELA